MPNMKQVIGAARKDYFLGRVTLSDIGQIVYCDYHTLMITIKKPSQQRSLNMSDLVTLGHLVYKLLANEIVRWNAMLNSKQVL